MSLVNDMLNDLEQRRSGQQEKSLDLGWLNAQPRVSSRRSVRPGQVVIGLLVLAILVLAAWNYLDKASAPSTGAGVKIESVPSAVTNDAAVTKSLSDLLSVNWSGEQGEARLQLSLNATQPYSLQREEKGLSLRIYDAVTGIKPHHLKPMPPVESIAINREGDDLLLTLKVSGEFSFSDRLVDTAGKRIEVSIRQSGMLYGKPQQDKQQYEKQQQAVASTSLAVVSGSGSDRPVKASPKSQPKIVGQSPQLTLSQQDMQTVTAVRELLSRGDYYHAEQQLEAFVEKNPGVPRASKLLATLRLKQQRYELAEQLLQAVLIQYPEDVEARSLRARLLLAQGNNEAALQWLMSSKPSLAKYSDYYELLGLAARKNQQYVLSEQVYRGLVDSDSSRGDWWVGLGIALDAQVKSAAAKEAFQRAVESRKTSATLRQYAQQRLAMQQ